MTFRNVSWGGSFYAIPRFWFNRFCSLSPVWIGLDDSYRKTLVAGIPFVMSVVVPFKITKRSHPLSPEVEKQIEQSLNVSEGVKPPSKDTIDFVRVLLNEMKWLHQRGLCPDVRSIPKQRFLTEGISLEWQGKDSLVVVKVHNDGYVSILCEGRVEGFEDFSVLLFGNKLEICDITGEIEPRLLAMSKEPS